MEISYKMNQWRQWYSSYSQLGIKFLKECVDKHWYQILYDCGITTKTLKRMVKKGLSWWEVDIVLSLLSLEEVSSVYIRNWEYELLQTIFTSSLQLFDAKCFMYLSLRFFSSRINRSFYEKTYTEAFFNTSKRYERYYLDRRYIFDPLIFFICELYKLKDVLSPEKMHELFRIDFLKNASTDPEKFLFMHNKNILKKESTNKDSFTIQWVRSYTGPEIINEIERLYKKIRNTFTANSISNIQKHCMKSGNYSIKILNHTYTNFVMHRQQMNKIPNIFLMKLRQTGVKLSQ